LALAASVRLALIIFFPSLYHPDENFQSLEPAHRIAFGYGILAWEFSAGMRSLLVPFLFAKLFTLIDWLFGNRQIYIPIARVLLAILSLISVAAVYRMGLRQSRTHALFVGLVAATWFELVYFSFRPLTEAIATDFLLIALSLASQTDGRFSRRQLVAIGFCVSLCLMLREHLAPGLLVICFWVVRRDFWTRIQYLIIGGLPPLIAFGTADYITWGAPFHSYFAAIRVNVGENKASNFGVEPAYWFAKRLIQLWAGAFPFLAALIAVRWRESRLWIITALVIIAFHSLIPHKEDRFVFPAHACLIIVAALASADVLIKWRQYLSAQDAARATVVAAVLWFATSLSLATTPGFFQNWRAGTQLINAFAWLHDQADLCGILLVDDRWWQTGGYAYLHRNVPIYDLDYYRDELTSVTQASNFIVLNRKSVPRFAEEYSVKQCFGRGDHDVCVVGRPGLCDAPSTLRLRPLLDRQWLDE
jgi:hypothetical protein